EPADGSEHSQEAVALSSHPVELERCEAKGNQQTDNLTAGYPGRIASERSSTAAQQGCPPVRPLATRWEARCSWRSSTDERQCDERVIAPAPADERLAHSRDVRHGAHEAGAIEELDELLEIRSTEDPPRKAEVVGTVGVGRLRPVVRRHEGATTGREHPGALSGERADINAVLEDRQAGQGAQRCRRES